MLSPLQYYPTTFYTFEPFHSFGNNVTSEQVHQILTNLLTCRYDKLQFLLDWVKQEEHQWLARWNRHYWSVCQLQRTDSCFNPEFASKVCKLSVLNLIKTIRINLSHAKELLDHPPQGTRVKVVHLVRDPRGMYASRMRVEPQSVSMQTMCRDLLKDYHTSLILRSNHSDDFMQIRYEDFSRDPIAMTESILEFAGLGDSQRVLKHLKYNIRAGKSDLRNMYSTKRNSSSVWYSWRDKLGHDDVTKIQESCRPFMDLMGYRLAPPEGNLTNFYPLNDT